MQPNIAQNPPNMQGMHPQQINAPPMEGMPPQYGPPGAQMGPN